MPIVTECPGCRHEYTLADAQAGKQLRCKHCGATFRAGQPERAAAAVTTARRPRDDDPRDEDRDEGPRRRKKQQTGGTLKVLFIVLGCIAGVFVVCGGLLVGGVYYVYYRVDKAVKAISSEVKAFNAELDKAMLDARVSEINLDTLRVGMPLREAEGTLGPASDKQDRADKDGPVTVVTWKGDKNTITGTFKNNKATRFDGDFNGRTRTVPDPDGKPNPTPTANRFVTKANYDRIGFGMTEPEVRAVVGRAPDFGSVQPKGGGQLRWNEAGTWLIVTFTDGKVSTKDISPSLR